MFDFNGVAQNLFDKVYNLSKDLVFNVSFTRDELDFIADLIRKDYKTKYGIEIKMDSQEFKLCNKLMTSYVSYSLEALKNEETKK